MNEVLRISNPDGTGVVIRVSDVVFALRTGPLITIHWRHGEPTTISTGDNASALATIDGLARMMEAAS